LADPENSGYCHVVRTAIDEHLMVGEWTEFQRKIDRVLNRIGHSEIAKQTPTQLRKIFTAGGGIRPQMAGPTHLIRLLMHLWGRSAGSAAGRPPRASKTTAGMSLRSGIQASQLRFALRHAICPSPLHTVIQKPLVAVTRAPSSGDNTSTPSTEVFHKRISLSIKAIGSVPSLRTRPNPTAKMSRPNNTICSLTDPLPGQKRPSLAPLLPLTSQTIFKRLGQSSRKSTRSRTISHSISTSKPLAPMETRLPATPAASTTRFVPVMYDDASDTQKHDCP